MGKGIIYILCFIGLLTGCTSTNNFEIHGVINIQGADEPLVVKISAAEPPQHMDFQGGEQLYLYEGDSLEVVLERDIEYAFTVYSTNQYLNTEIKIGDQLYHYTDEEITVKKSAFNEENKELVIEL
ncbi:hypothetical protein [Virgibacillus kimchii]